MEIIVREVLKLQDTFLSLNKNFNLDSIISTLGENEILETLNLCITEETISTYTEFITNLELFPNLMHFKVTFEEKMCFE